MDEAQANLLLIDQLKRHLSEALDELELYKIQEQLLLARLRKAEDALYGRRSTRIIRSNRSEREE